MHVIKTHAQYRWYINKLQTTLVGTINISASESYTKMIWSICRRLQKKREVVRQFKCDHTGRGQTVIYVQVAVLASGVQKKAQ